MIHSGRGWRELGMCKVLHRVLGWSDVGIAPAPCALMLLSACRSLGERWQQRGLTLLLGVRAAPGWHRGLVRWLVLWSAVSPRQDDYSTVAVSPV